MSVNVRKEIAYWFFLLAGIAGVSYFTYQYATTEKYVFLEWLGICSAFSVFIFKPTILLDVFNLIKDKIGKSK